MGFGEDAAGCMSGHGSRHAGGFARCNAVGIAGTPTGHPGHGPAIRRKWPWITIPSSPPPTRQAIHNFRGPNPALPQQTRLTLAVGDGQTLAGVLATGDVSADDIQAAVDAARGICTTRAS